MFRTGPASKRPDLRARVLVIGLVVAIWAGIPEIPAAQTQVPETPRQTPSMLAPLVARPAANAARVGSTFVAPPAVEDGTETDWRNANEEAARLGGHVGQLRGRPAQSRP